MINSFSFGRWPSPRINLVYPLSPPFSSRDISKIFEFSSHVFPHTYFRNGRNRKKGKFLLNARFLIESNQQDHLDSPPVAATHVNVVVVIVVVALTDAFWITRAYRRGTPCRHVHAFKCRKGNGGGIGEKKRRQTKERGCNLIRRREASRISPTTTVQYGHV